MKPEIKEKWLIALRSGEYKKGNCVLRLNSGGETFHCCLGVLCELHLKDTNQGVWEEDYYQSIDGSVRESFHLPPFVQEWSGVSTIHGYFKHEGGGGDTLESMNDKSTRSDFKDIIPIIEKYF